MDLRIGALKLKKTPRRLTRLIQLMYGQKCSEHNQPMNRTHLSEHHSIIVDPIAILKTLAEDPEHAIPHQRLGALLEEIKQLAKRPNLAG